MGCDKADLPRKELPPGNNQPQLLKTVPVYYYMRPFVLVTFEQGNY